jgi:PAS domain S-box-containing protein
MAILVGKLRRDLDRERESAVRAAGNEADLSAAKLAMEKTGQSEQRFHDFASASGDWFWETDVEHRYVWLSDGLERGVGRPASHYVGRTRMEVARAAGADLAAEPWKSHLEILARREPFRNFVDRRVTPTGEFWLSVSAVPRLDAQGKFLGYRAATTDITERRRVETALAAKTELLRDTFESMDEGISVADRNLRLVGWNRRFAELLDIPMSLLQENTTFADIIRFNAQRGEYGPGDVEEQVRGRVELAARFLPHRFERARPDGTVLEIRGSPLPGGGFVTTYADITERKRTEENLRASRSLMEQMIDAIPMTIFAKDRNSNYVMVNMHMANFFATSKEELLRRHTSRLPTSEAERRQALKDDAWVFRHRRALDKPETLIEGADGMQVPFHSTKIPLVDSAGELIGLLGINRDISEQKRAEAARASLEAQLRESQKMQAIGTLAGGIAHDFNNIIAAILGNAELARQDVSADSRVRESVEEIRKAAVRGREVVQQILSFSRRRPTARRPVALGPIVEESVRLLRATLPARVALEIRCDADVPMALADDTQIEQVLINLATNAMQAMQGGPGRIEIRLDTVLLDAALAGARPGLRALYAAHPGRTPRLAVRDDGAGMDAATLERIFEPFFTTKPQGEGTGLGLSVVHGIVLGHEGAIVVESEPGKGTTFTLYLPEAEAQPNAARPTAAGNEAAAPAAGAGERILYLDDDEALVFLVQRMLQRRGYRVSGYSSPKEALAALKTDPAGFDLVVSDYNMPGISGLEVARAVRDIRADLPVVIASGFIDEQLHAQSAGAGVREMIFKADAVEDLCNAIARRAQAGSAKAPKRDA